MLKCLIALTSLLSVAASAAPAWTWVDENGRRHYSDTPVDGATQIELGAPQTFTAVTPAATAASDGNGDGQPAFAYSVVDVISPEQEETLHAIATVLTVELAVYPALRSSDRIDVILDGERIRLGSRSLTLTVPEVYRGEHTLQAVVVDQDGEILMASQPRTFFVRQTSIR